MNNYKSGIIASILMLFALATSTWLAVPVMASNPLAATALPTSKMVTAQPLVTAVATKPAVTSTATATKPAATPTATKTNVPTATKTNAATATRTATSGPTATLAKTVTGTPGVEPTEILDPTETPTPTETPWPTDLPDATEMPTPTLVWGSSPTPSLTPKPVPTHISLVWPRFFPPGPTPKSYSFLLTTPQIRRAGTTPTRAVASASGARTATPQSFLSGLFPGSKPTQVAIAPQNPTQPDQSLDEEAMMPPEMLESVPEENLEDSVDLTWRLVYLASAGISSLLWFAGAILGASAVYVFLRARLRR